MDPCPACGCSASDGMHAHALLAALRRDDIDRALELGLLDPAVACTGCGSACRALLDSARTQRMNALAARERFRARNARLQRRQRERAERRKLVGAAATPATNAPALPPAAAAALARAKARAAQRGPR